MEGKKILVTGASGQFGRGFVHVLSKKNEVHALARFTNPTVLEEVEKKAEKVWKMDMGTERPADLPTDFDVIFHQAVGWQGDDVVSEQNKSFHMTCQFVGDLIYRNEKAVAVLGSTGSVYQSVEGVCKEDETPVFGGHTYVTTKIAMEQVAWWVANTFGRKIAVMRYFWPYAPYVKHPKVDSYLSGDIRGNNPDAISQRTYIKHHIDKTVLAAEHASNPPMIFNCATNENLTQRELATVGAKVTGAELSERAKGPGKPMGPGHTACSEKMVKHLGPTTVLTEEAFRRYHKAQQEGILWPEDWMFEGAIK